MQILVVVANFHMGTLKTEVEKGSMRTVLGHGLVGPKGQVCSDYESNAFFLEREWG